MYVSEIAYKLTIVATKAEPKNYVVEVERSGLKTQHYTVGPNNSVANLVGRLCAMLEAGRK
jgi:hypothetical protein